MARLPKVFEPTMHVPQGLNNYSGNVFRCFTRGDTLPFRFVFSDSEATLDVTGWTVVISMSDKADAGNCDNGAVLVEVEIPLTDLATATFEGNFSDEHTQALPAGIVYAVAKYVTAPVDEDTPGDSFILDMCTLEVYPNPTRL